MQVWPMTRRRRFEDFWGRLVADYSWYGTTKMFWNLDKKLVPICSRYVNLWPRFLSLLLCWTMGCTALQYVHTSSAPWGSQFLWRYIVSSFMNYASKLWVVDLLVGCVILSFWWTGSYDNWLKETVLYLYRDQTFWFCWTYKFTEINCVRT